MTSPEDRALVVTLVNAAAEESRIKNQAIAKLLEMMELRIARLERKV